MHIIILLLTAVAGALFWGARVARGASELSDATEGLRNLPRKRRFQKHARASGFALVDTPVEAATALLLSCAALGRSRALTPLERDMVMDALTNKLGQTTLQADELVIQIGALLHDVAQPTGAVAPMVRVLAPALERRDALVLASAIDDVAAAEGGATDDQARFAYKYRERMGLLG